MSKSVICTLNAGETRYIYFKLTRMPKENFDYLESSDHKTSLALERLVKDGHESVLESSNIHLQVTNIGQPLSSCCSPAFTKMLAESRTSNRLKLLSAQYPLLTQRQIEQMFGLFFQDDVELCLWWESKNRQGHLFHSGLNACLESPVPLSSWLSKIDIKKLTSHILFEQTARERTKLISSFIKTEESPVRVMIHSSSEYKTNEY